MAVQYNNHTAAWEMIEVHDEVLFNQLKEHLADARVVNLIIDESTDVSTSANLITFVTYVFQGNFQCKLLKLAKLGGKDAASITAVRALLSIACHVPCPSIS